MRIKRIIGLIEKTFKYLRKYGIKYTYNKVFYMLKLKKNYKFILMNEETLLENKVYSNNCFLKFSILVPIYNTKYSYFIDMIESVKDQRYTNWELCLVDGSDNNDSMIQEYLEKNIDSRIKYEKISNEGIAKNTNKCIDMATGQYICLFDHDDILHKNALSEINQRIIEKDADFLYTNELTFEKNITNVISIHCKPDYSLDNLRANNYICHFTCFRKELLNRTGIFSEQHDGSQDYDLFLRLTENAKKIEHINLVLYYWRSHRNSVAADIGAKTYAIEAGRKAILDSLFRHNIEAEVTVNSVIPTIYNVEYSVKDSYCVSIIIGKYLSKKRLMNCIESIISNSNNNDIELIVMVDSDIISPTDIELFSNNTIEIKYVDVSSNFEDSQNYNVAVDYATGDYILFINGNSIIETEDFIYKMVMYCQRSDVSAVGCQICLEDNSIWNAGMVLGKGKSKVIESAYYGHSKYSAGYFGRLLYAGSVTAVSMVCMMVGRKSFMKNKFSEKYCNDYFDYDWCMNMQKNNGIIVMNPQIKVKYYSENRVQNQSDKDIFAKRWSNEILLGDKYYNSFLV